MLLKMDRKKTKLLKEKACKLLCLSAVDTQLNCVFPGPRCY